MKWDKALRPCEEAARSAGILMTPVLVVNGRIVYEGSIPCLDELRKILDAAMVDR